MKQIKPEDIPEAIVDKATDYWAGDAAMYWDDEESAEFNGLIALVISEAVAAGLVLPGGSDG